MLLINLQQTYEFGSQIKKEKLTMFFIVQTYSHQTNLS